MRTKLCGNDVSRLGHRNPPTSAEIDVWKKHLETMLFGVAIFLFATPFVVLFFCGDGEISWTVEWLFLNVELFAVIFLLLSFQSMTISVLYDNLLMLKPITLKETENLISLIKYADTEILLYHKQVCELGGAYVKAEYEMLTERLLEKTGLRR